MAEREIIVDHLRLTYSGLFSVVELYKLIDGWLRTMQYEKREKKSIEKVTAEGKYIELEIEPWKKATDYAKNIIRARIIMSDVKDVEVEKEKTKIKLNQGTIQIVFDGILETDYEHRWEEKPLFWFIRAVFDKYIFKPYTGGFKKGIIDDVNHLHTTIKSFLNMYRYAPEAWTAPSYMEPRP